MNLTIRPWQEGDEVSLATNLGVPENGQVAAERPLLGPAASSPWRRCLVAADDGGELIAAGAVAATRLHPDRLWLYIEVAPKHRRQGIGSQLASALAAEVVPDQPQSLKSRFSTSSVAAVGFATAIGMTQIQRSRMIDIRAGILGQPDFVAGGQVLEDLATGSVELTKFVASFYEAIHAGWDRAQMSLAQAQDLLLSPAAGARGAVVLRARTGAQLQAFAISYAHPQEADQSGHELTENGPTDVLLGYDTSAPQLESMAAITRLIAILTATHPIRIEVDDAAESLARVVHLLDQENATEVHTETLIVARDL